MKVFIVFTFISLVGISAAYHNMVNLGSVYGKNYYADESVVDWAAANTICRQNGMELASINSEAEADFLKNAYSQLHLREWHWVGAVEDYSHIFKWSSTGERVEIYHNLRMHPQGSVGGSEKCLTFGFFQDPNFHRETQPAYYFPEECHHVQRTLCQSYQQFQHGPIYESFGPHHRPHYGLQYV